MSSENWGAVKQLVSESAIHGVVLISGLLVIVANQPDAPSRETLVKVLATAAVFWLAHVYAGTVAHLGDRHEHDQTPGSRLALALRASLKHSWGMLLAALLPALILGFGVLGLLSHERAVWGTLWVDVAILAVLGFIGVATWTDRLWPRLVGGLATGLLGIVMIALKAMIH